jgi:hypothetical protein
MTKYTRSVQKLSAAIKDIFATKGISLDTKAILLILAATMSPGRFKALIEPLDDLGCTRVKLFEINDIRARLGGLFRDFIILNTLKACKRQITSDELQGFISMAGREPKPDSSKQLNSALSSLESLDPETSLPEITQHKNFSATMQKATDFLVDNLTLGKHPQVTAIIETFLHCRVKVEPVVAYFAVMHAMAEIFKSEGIEAKQALLNSYKLTKHALEVFLNNDAKNNYSLLPTYKSVVDSAD